VTEAAGEVRAPVPPPASDRGLLWVAQSWDDLLFAHWRVERARVRALVPPELELDTWDGDAWVGVVPFVMRGVRARFLPPVPGASEFPELNVRTYVRHGGVSGVYFFSLDAASALAVVTARALWGLPYHRADMTLRHEDGWVVHESRRRGRADGLGRFRARCRPLGTARPAERGTLLHWLAERYALFVVRGGRVARGDVEHPPWELAEAEAVIDEDTMAAAAGLPLTGPPELLHVSRRQPTRAWLPRAVDAGTASG